MNTITQVITDVQSRILAGVSAIKSAPVYPTDKRMTDPTCIAFADNIRFDAISGGFQQKFFDLRIEIMISRKDMTQAFQYLDGIPEAIAAIFAANPTLGGLISTSDGEITALIAKDTINGIPCVGYVITVPNIKMQ